MPRIYNIEMSRRQYVLVPQIIRLLVSRLEEPGNPTITYKELATRLNTSYRRLGQPLLKMAYVLEHCPIKNVPTLNAMVVYSTSHLPSLDGLRNACPNVDINNGNLMQVMNKLNKRAKDFKDWDKVLKSIDNNSEE